VLQRLSMYRSSLGSTSDGRVVLCGKYERSVKHGQNTRIYNYWSLCSAGLLFPALVRLSNLDKITVRST
jgi:hypothetical protein